MRFVWGFVPWLVYTTIGARIDWLYGASITLAVAVVLVLWDLAKRKPLDAMVMQFSAVTFFGCTAAFAALDHGSPLNGQMPAAAAGWLALTACGSLIARRPFTAGMLKLMLDPGTPLSSGFWRLNRVLTSVWAASFMAQSVAVALIIGHTANNTNLVIVLKALGWAVPMLFSIAYPKLLRKRAARAAPPVPEPPPPTRLVSYRD